MPTIKDYKKAIKIISGDNLPCEKIVEKLAEERPDVLVKICGLLSIHDSPEWYRQAKALAEAGQKIEAIKAVRAACNMGLKEAKDYVEAEFK